MTTGLVPPDGYLVRFFRQDDDGKMTGLVPLPSLPPEGTLVVMPGGPPGAWRVTAVQLFLPEAGSKAERDGHPLHADVTVRPARGVHAGVPQDERGGEGGER